MPRTGTGSALKIGALILAAGRSSRMGQFKPLVQLNGTSLLDWALTLFRKAGLEEVVTVIGWRAETLIPLLEASSSRYVVNENHHHGMFSSIQKGVAELQNLCDAFFLLPVDIPCVQAATLQQLQEQFAANPSILICYPQYSSKRGHPPLIAAALIGHIIAYNGEGGMRTFLQSYEARAVNVTVADPFVRFDVDTEHDLLCLEKELKDYITKC